MKNDYKKKKPVTDANSRFSIRHLPIAGGGAQPMALLGATPKEQVEANWDAWKLGGGSIGGMLAGGLAGAVTADSLGYGQHSLPGVGMMMGGILGGGLLGNYLTFKTMAKNRKVDADYSFRHLLPGAQIAALQGYSPEDQVESNWNHLKTTVPSSVVSSVVSGLTAPISPLGSTVLGNSAGVLANIGAYEVLRNQKINEGLKKNKKK